MERCSSVDACSALGKDSDVTNPALSSTIRSSITCAGCGPGDASGPCWHDGRQYCTACQVRRFQEQGGWDLTMPPLICDRCDEGYPPKLLTVRDHQAICYRCRRTEQAAEHAEDICACRRWLPFTIVWSAVLLILFTPMTLTSWAPLVALLAMPLQLWLVFRLARVLEKQPLLPWIGFGCVPWIGMFPLWILVHQATDGLRRSGVMVETGLKLIEQRGDPLGEGERGVYVAALVLNGAFPLFWGTLLMMVLWVTAHIWWSGWLLLVGGGLQLLAFGLVLWFRLRIRRFYGAGAGELSKNDAQQLYEQWLGESHESVGVDES